MQVVDVIVLRPEVELCYMGVAHKCFEILENRPHEDAQNLGGSHSTVGGHADTFTDDEDEDEDDASDDEDDEDDGTAVAPMDPDETESDMSDHDDSDNDSYSGSDYDVQSKVRLRLREILFYDDKVAIFKARHGRL